MIPLEDLRPEAETRASLAAFTPTTSHGSDLFPAAEVDRANLAGM